MSAPSPHAPAADRAAAVRLAAVWSTAAFFALALFAVDFTKLDGLVIDGAVMWGRDFVNVWTAAHALIEGKPDLLYDVPAYQSFQRTLFATSLDSHNYSYPPLGLPLVLPFGLLPYPLALGVWLGSTGWLFAHAARPWMAATRLPAWLAVLTPAALLNIWAGHYGFLIGALWLLGWSALERSPRRAGILFGLLALKPHLALFVPVILLARREWAAIAWVAVTVALLLLVSALLFGIQPWIDYLTVTSGEQARMIDAGRAFFGTMSTSVLTASLKLGAAAPLAGALYGAGALSAFAMVVRAALTRAPVGEVALLAATATFLVLPYAFVYDLTVTAVGVLWLAGNRWQILGRWERWAALGGLAAPVVGMLVALGQGVLITPLLLLGLAGVQYRALCRAAGISRPASPAVAASAHSI